MLLRVEERLVVSLDVPGAGAAKSLAGLLAGRVGLFKVGMELFYAAGPAVVPEITAAGGAGVFLDLKLHDIPNTVAAAVRSLVRLAPAILNLHASGGFAMMKAARAAAREEAARLGGIPPKLVAVTVLTALDEEAFRQAGYAGDIADTVRRMAHLAREAGLDGVVAAATEAAMLRRDLGEGFLIITPGIRPTGSAADDQRRVLTPREAVRAGASHLVVGRPVTGAPDPVRAVEGVLAEMRQAVAEKG